MEPAALNLTDTMRPTGSSGFNDLDGGEYAVRMRRKVSVTQFGRGPLKQIGSAYRNRRLLPLRLYIKCHVEEGHRVYQASYFSLHQRGR